jgi:TonB family protein
MGSSKEPLAAPESETLAPVVPQKSTPMPVKEQLITQNENINAINEQKQEIKKRKEKQLADQQKIEADKAIAQQKNKEQDAINKAAKVNGLFGNGSTTSGTGNGQGSGNGTGKGSGDGSGDGIQGNPAGHGNLGGNSWSLNGRSLTGRLISPSYDKDVEGKITVNIRVDESGHVSSASIGSPTTISDAETRNAAMSAAHNTRFSAGKGIVTGTITYNFKLR